MVRFIHQRFLLSNYQKNKKMTHIKIKKFCLAILLMFFVSFGYTQSMGPADPGGDPEAGPPLGGGAPIGSGIGILIALGAAYGGKKLYTLYSENHESLEE